MYSDIHSTRCDISDKSIDFVDEESALLSGSASSSSSAPSSSSSRMSKVTMAFFAVTISVLALVGTYSYKGLNLSIYGAKTDDDEYGDADNEGSWSVNDDEAKNLKSVHGLSTALHVKLKDLADSEGGVLTGVHKCLNWIEQFDVKPGAHWGRLPKAQKDEWRSMDCDKKLEIHEQAMKFERRHGKLITTGSAPAPAAAVTRSSTTLSAQPLKSRVDNGVTTLNTAIPPPAIVSPMGVPNSVASAVPATPSELDSRHDQALRATGLSALEKQIEEDLAGEDLSKLAAKTTGLMAQNKESASPELTEEELAAQPGSFEPPTYLCSLEPPTNGPNEAEECAHKQMSFFVKADEHGQWPSGFSYTLVQLTGIGPNHRKTIQSDVGGFKQPKGMKCDSFVRKLCLNGEYTLYAHNSRGKLLSDSATPGVETCDHSFSVQSGAALHFKANAAAECLNTQYDADSGHKFSLNEHKAFLKSRQDKFMKFSVKGGDDKITEEEDDDESTVAEVTVEEDESADVAKPVKYSDSTLQRKQEELVAQDKKISLTKDKIKLDSDRITLDQNQLGRYKQDIKAEEELLRIFRGKGEKQSAIIDKDQETLQKDEQNLQILFYQRGEIQKEIDNPYYKADKDTDGAAGTSEDEGNDDADVAQSNNTNIDGEGMGLGNATSTDEGEGVGLGNATSTGEGEGTSPSSSNSTAPVGDEDGATSGNSTQPVTPVGEGGNNSTIPFGGVGGDNNSTGAGSDGDGDGGGIPSDTEKDCKPTISNAYCSKTFKKIESKVKGEDDGDKSQASIIPNGLRGFWDTLESEVEGKSPSSPSTAAAHTVDPAVARSAPIASKHVVPVSPASATKRPVVVQTPTSPASAALPPKPVVTEDHTVATPAVHATELGPKPKSKQDTPKSGGWSIF